jgi:hypothetical protein
LQIDQELCVFEEVPLREALHSALHKVAPIHSMKACGGLEDQLHLISAPDGCIALCFGERAAGIHVIGNWIVSRLHLGVSEKRKIVLPFAVVERRLIDPPGHNLVTPWISAA